jgi:hypothetical protein
VTGARAWVWHHRGHSSTEESVTEASSNNTMIKGCAIAFGVTALLACCGLGIGMFACGGLMNFGQETQLQVISASMHAAASLHPRSAEYEAELQRFDALRPSVGFLTFGVISNRFNTANADGRIDETELDHLMLLVVDIDNHGGNVDINQYPGGT